MKIIIKESQYRLIKENEEYLGQIMGLIETFDEDNIKLAFEIAKGLKIKQSYILEEYRDLINVFGYKPTLANLLKIIKLNELECHKTPVPDLLFKLPNLNKIEFKYHGIKNLDNLVEFDGSIIIAYTSYDFNGLPSLKRIGGSLIAWSTIIKTLPNLEYVGGDLTIMEASLKSFDKLKYVGGNLKIKKNPLSKLITKEELRNKIDIKGKISL